MVPAQLTIDFSGFREQQLWKVPGTSYFFFFLITSVEVRYPLLFKSTRFPQVDFLWRVFCVHITGFLIGFLQEQM